MIKKRMSVREFLADIVANEILPNKKYDLRIDIEDGGYNSYIGFKVSLDDWKSKGKIESVRLFRHTNSENRMSDRWEFSLGEICNEYHTYPDIPIRFSSFGKTLDEAETEATGYYNRIRKLVRKENVAGVWKVKHDNIRTCNRKCKNKTR